MAAQHLPDGTRYALPGLAQGRARLLQRLGRLYEDWGYQPVEVPALESYDPSHPRSAQSFKLTDRDSSLLALRSDFTPALSGLVRLHYRDAAAGDAAVRLQYSGTVWHAIDPDLAHYREFTQVGIELVGVSNALADAELIHLARESVRAVGLAPRVEIGNPAFVRALFDLADLPLGTRDALADALDRKDERTLLGLLDTLRLPADLRAALQLVPDLYGQQDVLDKARRSMPWPETLREIDRIEEILEQFEDRSELLLELGMARRLSYYTGMTFRAYTFDFGQPLLGGGRYDGALLPYAAGFSLGLERLMSAMPDSGQGDEPVMILSSDDAASRTLRRAGYRVLRALSSDPAQLHAEALAYGAGFVVREGVIEALDDDPELLDSLRALLGAAA